MFYRQLFFKIEVDVVGLNIEACHSYLAKMYNFIDVQMMLVGLFAISIEFFCNTSYNISFDISFAGWHIISHGSARFIYQ